MFPLICREIILKQTECIHSTFDVGRSSVFFSVRLDALAAGLNSEPQNIEYRTAEFRRMESLRSFFLINKNR